MYKVTKDTTLLAFLMDVSKQKRTSLKNALKHQEVYVNHQIETYYAYELHEGDEVEIVHHRPQDLPFPILYEDRDLIVIDKPSGLVAEQTRNNKNKTAFALTLAYVKKKKESLYLVHRLDEATSGVMMFVKNKKLANELTHHWNEYVLERGYLAVVEGVIRKGGHIENNLAENKAQIVYIAKKGGKKAITDYKVLKSNKKYTLLDVSISTGRKNQIRVHMASLHHPISGDLKYGGHNNSIRRLALHADVFAFRHPFTHQTMRFTSPMPESFQKLVK